MTDGSRNPVSEARPRGRRGGGGGRLVIEYRRLDGIAHLPRNAKGHDVGAIVLAMREFGVIDPLGVNDLTGHDIDGNGRLMALRSMMAENATRLPGGVIRAEDGMWLVPVVSGISLSEGDEARASLALNHSQTLGGYDEVDLAAILADIASAGTLVGTTYDIDDVDMLLRNLSRARNPAGRRTVAEPDVLNLAPLSDNPPADVLTEETVATVTAASDLEMFTDAALPESALMWPLVSLRIPPDLYQEFRLGVMLLQQARGYKHFYEALISMVREFRSRLVITEEAYGPSSIGRNAG